MRVEISGNDTIFTRIINAPRTIVFKAWTDPKHLTKWWGPHIMACPVCEVDLRPGGSYRIVMRDPGGVDYPITGFYREIVVPERIVSTVNTDEHPQEWHELLSKYRPGGGRAATENSGTITFEEQGAKTKLTIRTHFASAADRNVFMKTGMTDGWAQSLERLEKLVAKVWREGSCQFTGRVAPLPTS
jgi:uncharacterized protein YndB with AHSA1/START domain